jgi:hypothetical protein
VWAEEPKLDPKDPIWLQLPRSLTSFKARYVQKDLDIHPSVLPPLLKQVNTRKVNMKQEAFDYSHLRHLSLLSVAVCFTEQAENQSQATSEPEEISDLSQMSLGPVSSPSLQCLQFILPSMLTSLYWTCQFDNPPNLPDVWYFRDEFISWLPGSLETFYCDDARFLTNHFLYNLPKSLFSLTLSLKPKEVPANIDSTGLKSLPPNLTYLQAAISPSSDDSFVPFLPKSLKTLSIERLQVFSDVIVPHLPRKLSHLHLRHVMHGLTDAGISALPRSLGRLELEHNKTWTPEAFFAHDLPYLTYLDIRANPNFTKSRVLALAPATLDIKGKKFLRERN